MVSLDQLALSGEQHGEQHDAPCEARNEHPTYPIFKAPRTCIECTVSLCYDVHASFHDGKVNAQPLLNDNVDIAVWRCVRDDIRNIIQICSSLFCLENDTVTRQNTHGAVNFNS